MFLIGKLSLCLIILIVSAKLGAASRDMEGVVQKAAGRSLSSPASLAKGLLYMQIRQLFHCGAFIYPGEGEIW